MATKWIVWCILAGLFAVAECGLLYWSMLPDQRGQAMPAFIVPALFGVVAVIVLGIIAFIVWGV